MRWPRRAKQSCWRGVRELPRRVSPRCQPRPGRWLRRKCVCWVSREASAARASVGPGCTLVIAMHGKPARRPARARRWGAENVIGYDDVTWISTCAARLYRARWGQRCCAVRWSTARDDKRRGWMLYIGFLWQAVIDDEGGASPTRSQVRLSLREQRLPIVPAAMNVSARRHLRD